MVSLWAVALVVPAVLLALVDWRKGLFALLCVGFLQDPARKLEADQPVYFMLLVGVVFGAAYFRAQSHTLFWPSQISGWNRYMRMPSAVFAFLLVAQAVNSVVVYDNPTMSGIGALSYLAPLPALLLGYHFALKEGRARVQRWLTWYLIGTFIFLPSILLQFWGVEWVTLGQVGEGFYMHVPGFILTPYSGFFRASETAAWHTATAVCLLLLFASMRKLSLRQIVFSIAVVVALLAIGILTGRRKMLVEIGLFVCIYLALLLYFGKHGAKLAAGIFAAGVLSYAVAIAVIQDQPTDVQQPWRYQLGGSSYQYYAQRSASVTYEISDRFVDLGLEPVFWAIQSYGWLGGGLGVASQGAQHFGGGAEIYGGAGEGGPGKITAELGIPGLLIVVWFGIAGVCYGWQVLTYVSRRSSVVARLAYGLAALLIANLGVFFVATQLFSDIFVQLLLGLMAGVFLATPVLADRERPRLMATRRPVAISGPTVIAGATLRRADPYL